MTQSNESRDLIPYDPQTARKAQLAQYAEWGVGIIITLGTAATYAIASGAYRDVEQVLLDDNNPYHEDINALSPQNLGIVLHLAAAKYASIVPDAPVLQRVPGWRAQAMEGLRHFGRGTRHMLADGGHWLASYLLSKEADNLAEQHGMTIQDGLRTFANALGEQAYTQTHPQTTA